jgi:hypothetical protein
MVIRYYLREAATAGATVIVTNPAGQEIARLQGSGAAGVNTVVWSTRLGGGRGGRGGGAPGGGAPASANPIDQWAPLGDYTVTLEAGGRTLTAPARITKTQGWSFGPTPQVIR